MTSPKTVSDLSLEESLLLGGLRADPSSGEREFAEKILRRYGYVPEENKSTGKRKRTGPSPESKNPTEKKIRRLLRNLQILFNTDETDEAVLINQACQVTKTFFFDYCLRGVFLSPPDRWRIRSLGSLNPKSATHEDFQKVYHKFMDTVAEAREFVAEKFFDSYKGEATDIPGPGSLNKRITPGLERAVTRLGFPPKWSKPRRLEALVTLLHRCYFTVDRSRFIPVESFRSLYCWAHPHSPSVAAAAPGYIGPNRGDISRVSDVRIVSIKIAFALMREKQIVFPGPEVL